MKRALKFKPNHDFGLVDDGWLSPDTYDSHFSKFDDIPAIYAFMAVDFKDLNASFIAYVGMSTALRTRWNAHPVLKEIREHGFWVKRFFKPTSPENLRSLEREYIQRFNPPWNISGKARGLSGAINVTH